MIQITECIKKTEDDFIKDTINIIVKNLIERVVELNTQYDELGFIEINQNPIVNQIIINGKFIGEGSYGKVVSNPRLPLKIKDIYNKNQEIFEKIEDLVTRQEVSKIFKFKIDYINEVEFYKINHFINNCAFTKYIVLPIGYGTISKSQIDNYEINYIKSDDKYLLKLSSCLIEESKLYHIVFPKGYSIYKTTFHPMKFLIGIQNIIKCLSIITDGDLFLPDLKIFNIVDIYDYKKDNIPIKNNPKSYYKLIDYTTMMSISSNKIDYTLDLLFFKEQNFFDCGFDYSAYPSYQIMLLRYLLNNIKIDVNLDLDNNISAGEIYRNKMNTEEIIYDDLHIYLLEFLSKNDMNSIYYTDKIFTIEKYKLQNFKINIKLFNTTTMQYNYFEINESNIFMIFDQIYYDKFGYVEINFKQLIREVKNPYINKSRKQQIHNKFDEKIKEYLIYFNIWANFFLKIYKNTSKTEKSQILLKMIQNYSFGMIIFDFLSNYYNKKTYDEVYTKLLTIGLYSCLIQIYNDDGDLLINLNTFSDIKNIYYNLVKN